jgi:hypothetical protein
MCTDTRSKTGKTIVIAVIALLIFSEVVTTVGMGYIYMSAAMKANNPSILAQGIPVIFQGVVRIGICVVLSVFLYKGYAWAKWVTVGLAAIVIMSVAHELFIQKVIPLYSPYTGAMVLTAALLLLFSRTGNAFLAKQRGRNKE